MNDESMKKDWELFNFRAPPELLDWLKRRAKAEMTTASSLVRRLIQAYVAQVDAEALKRMRGG
jgi:predicted DNA-binding protein